MSAPQAEGASVNGSAEPLPGAPAPQSSDPQQLVLALRALRQAPHDAAYWQQLCVCLGLLCRASAVAVLREQPGATWHWLGSTAASDSPLRSDTGTLLAELLPRALAQGHAWGPHGSGKLVAAVRLLDPAGATVALLELPGRERAAINELLIRAQLVADLPERGAAAGLIADSALLPMTGSNNAPNHAADAGADQLLALLDLVARVMQERDFGAAVLSVVNLLASVVGCEQVVLGRCVDGQVKVLAISHIDRFEHEAENVLMLEAALEEAVDQHVDIVYPPPADSATVVLAHDRLSRLMGYGQLATLVLRDEQPDPQPQLVLLLARRDQALPSVQLQQVAVALHLLQPWLLALRERTLWWGARWRTAAGRRASQWLSPEQPAAKGLALAALLLLLGLVFGTWPYRIEASGELGTDAVQVISAPFDGYLAQVQANLGDTVQAGAVLAQLDVRELGLQAADLQSELRRYDAEADRARAASQVADTEIALARAAQAKARLERVLFQLQQAQVVSPFVGVIVEGERKELAGAPVRQGDKLFRLARIEGLYAVVHVSERDMRELPPQAKGRLRLLSQPDQSIGFQVDTLVPVAQVKGTQGSQFALKVRLDQAAQAWWRPGMTGLAHIDAGDRRILWIWTHKLVDTLRLMLWW